ncbi:MAG: hypothetical protein ACU0AT_08735 [Tranquillimonas sp.]
MIKLVSLFLIAMVALAMFGRLRFPGAKRLADLRCRSCGRYRIGRGACPCGKG